MLKTCDVELQERIRLAPGQLIATRIKRARKTAGPAGTSLSHDKFGELIGGVTRQHLIKLEQAKHRPRAETLTKIAAASGRDIDWFLDPEVDPSPFPDELDASGGDAGRADRRAGQPAKQGSGSGAARKLAA